VEVGGHARGIQIKARKEISDRLQERQCQPDADKTVDEVAEWNTAARRTGGAAAFQ
jgi:hypothetical protein